ncbi:MAG: hypothetical protein U5K54_04765 [Cytophagales bacterium]|nr:hypothetical protein [Cytophagales bacterium]
MKKLSYLFFVSAAVIALTAFRPVAGKLVSKNAHISFFSHTAVKDITANNYKVVSTFENLGDRGCGVFCAYAEF